MRLSPLDSLFLAIDSVESPAHVGGLMIYEIPKNYKGNFVRDLKERLLASGKPTFPFSHRLKPQGIVPRWPEWEEDVNLDLTFHLRHSGLPKPGTMEDLYALVSRLHARQLDRARPLWEFYLIEGLSGNRFATYTKMHHAIVDGMGGIEMLDQVLTVKPDLKKITAPWSPVLNRGKKKGEKAGIYNQMKRTTQRSIKQALAVPQAMNAVLAPTVGLKKTKAGKAFDSKSSFVNKRISASRTFALGGLPLDEVKAVGKVFDATVNDVFLTACSGALSKQAKKLGSPIDEHFTAGMPVALSRDGKSNAVTSILVNLYPNITNVQKRLKAIQESAQAAKDDLADMNRQAIDTMTILGWGTQIAVAEMDRTSQMRPISNLIISNVPGLREERFFGGAKLLGLYPLSVLLHSQGLNITVLSMGNQLEFSLLSTPEIIPNIEAVADDVVREYHLLKTAAEKKLGKKVVPVSRASTKKQTISKKAPARRTRTTSRQSRKTANG